MRVQFRVNQAFVVDCLGYFLEPKLYLSGSILNGVWQLNLKIFHEHQEIDLVIDLEGAQIRQDARGPRLMLLFKSPPRMKAKGDLLTEVAVKIADWFGRLSSLERIAWLLESQIPGVVVSQNDCLIPLSDLPWVFRKMFRAGFFFEVWPTNQGSFLCQTGFGR